MSKTMTSSLRNLVPAASLPRAALSKRSINTGRPRKFQCISPLARRPAEWTARSSLTQLQQVRNVYTNRGTALRERVRQLQKENPFLFPLSLGCIGVGFLCAVYATYYYINTIYPIDSTYPAPVAGKLKRALYYTYQDVQPQKAWDYYRQALQLADEVELHPFSAEVLGIKLQTVAMLERTNHLKEAVEVLEILKSDCTKFVEYCDAPDKAALREHRTRVLEKVVQMGVKLGEFYSNVYLRDDEAAERHLIESLETLLKESHRRQSEGVKEEDEGPWMNDEQIGGSLEALADLYEQQSKHYLAAPLYLRAVTLAQPPSCHTAVLMNNLAASLAQTSPERPAASSDTSRQDPPTSRTALVSNARQWTEKSLAICQSLKPPARTEECDAACAVATHNLGEFAEMEGLVDEARRRYGEAKSLAKVLGFADGVENADRGLKRLDSQP